MNRLEKKFKELKDKRKKAFIAFITAGYPGLSATEKLVREFARVGVDIVELGVPFSDPMADGPMIQEASEAALKKNTSLADILELVKRLRRDVDIPIALMTYYNPVFCFGEERFVRRAVACGVDAVIVPDLPPEEARPLMQMSARKNLEMICFLSPTSSPKRIKLISALARGFIYYVSLTGTTGARKSLASGLAAKIKQIKRRTKKPVCVGFGVSNSSQVRQIYKIADGVIVGSAVVRAIKENSRRPDLAFRVGEFVRRLKNV